VLCVFSSAQPSLRRRFALLRVRVCTSVILLLISLMHFIRSCRLIYLHNPTTSTTGRQHYRLYTIKNIPSLKILDYVKISKSERDRAERLANSAAGAALEADVRDEQQQQSSSATSKTFVPGEGLDIQKAFKAIFTAEEKEQIRDLVANASSPAEIEEIEQSVKRGVLPLQLQQLNRKRQLQNDNGATTTEENNHAGNYDADDQHVAKKVRNGDT
jgi:hypothetical protein